MSRIPAEVPKHILVNLGGIDKDNVTTHVLNALQASDLESDCSITVVMGKMSPWLADVKARALNMKYLTRVLVSPENFSLIMSDCDLAIGACGTTALERCCIGLPSIVIVVADNQRYPAMQMEKVGAAYVIHSMDKVETMTREAIELMIRLGDLERIKTNCANLTEGTGAAMTSKILLP